VTPLPQDVGDLDWDTITTEPTPLDLAGQTRVQAILIDMGAYEYQSKGGGGPD